MDGASPGLQIAIIVPSLDLLNPAAPCDFVSVTINAQKAGAVAVLFVVDNYHITDDGSGGAESISIPAFRITPTTTHWNATLAHLFASEDTESACRQSVDTV